ncbi:chloride channel protein [Chloropicon primus]|uniref:Chloride channel protein n=1 Tax=Chloropicon primus TaxID=1764295 RepID=A0A5B8MQH1_9CHLO|nr:chloride channel protein [Chloropicon primus]UPR01993.1 chloride channel protein [Chloropicon primus]|eukprot:QDZ22769.1 chloride channel protein [Chloropicon primus]
MRRGSKTYIDLATHSDDEELELGSMPFGRSSSAKYEDVDALYGSEGGRATFHLKEEEHHLEALEKMNRFECKDYDICDSQLNKLTNSVKSKKEYNLREALCWLLPIVIGVLMGITAFVVDIGIEWVVTFRYERTKDKIYANSSSIALPLFIFVSTSAAFTCVAGGLVAFVEPLAAGSGIPEVKTYLNGVRMKNLLHIKTLVAKLCGIMFSIGAGLIAGKEGPFVHGGAIVGSGVSAMASKALGWRINGKYANLFRNDVDHREFTAIGTAAGVATAFGAPIGGALFTIEEGCSFYSTFVFWRCFIATCSGVLTLHALVEARHTTFDVSEAKLGNHRDFGLYSDGDANYGEAFWYYVWEFPVFVIVGILGGLMGALFIHLNVKITMWRRKHIPVDKRNRRFYEVVAIAVLTSIILFSFAKASPCRTLPENAAIEEKFNEEEAELSGEDTVKEGRHMYFPRLWCEEGKYSVYGQLLMVPLSEALRMIVHLGETVDCTTTGCQSEIFPSASLFVFLVVIYLLMTLTYGVSAPTGLFVPSLAVGAAMGHLVGQILQNSVGADKITINMHTYSILGAAASLGGATRMTLSIAVLVMETTGAMQLIVPIMLVIFISKIVGDFFNEGIYDTHIHIRGAPLLEESGLSSSHRMITEKVSIGDVAKKELVVLPSKIQVRSLVEILKNCSHNSFPIVNGAEKSKMVIEGSISRVVLYKMLEHRLGLYNNASTAEGGEEEASGVMSEDLDTKYVLPKDQRRRRNLQNKLEPRIDGEPLHLDLLEFELNQENFLESHVYVDMTPFMQQNPFVLSPDTSLSRAYHLFRTMGLRYLLVGHAQPVVSGIITRKDLTEEHIKISIGKKVRRRMKSKATEDAEDVGERSANDTTGN